MLLTSESALPLHKHQLCSKPSPQCRESMFSERTVHRKVLAAVASRYQVTESRELACQPLLVRQPRDAGCLLVVLNVHEFRHGSAVLLPGSAPLRWPLALPSHAHGPLSKGRRPRERLVGFPLGLYFMHESVVITFQQITCC